MLTRFMMACGFAIALTTMCAGVCASKDAPRAPASTDDFTTLIGRLRAATQARDSLGSLVDSTTGGSREFLEELVAQRDAEARASVLAVVDRIQSDRARGLDVSDEQRRLQEAVEAAWPRYRARLQRRMQELISMTRASDAVSGADRVELESRLSRQSDHLLEAYRSLVEVLITLERAGLDVSEQRRFLVEGIPPTAQGLVTRVQLAGRARANALSRVSRDASNADLRYALDAAEERLKRTTRSLSTAIQLMDRLQLEDSDLRVALIAATGRLTADVFNGKVLLGLVKTLWTQVVEFLAGKALPWLFQGFLIVLTFLGFRALSQLVRRVVRRVVQHYHTSELMRRTIVQVAGSAVMLIGLAVILTQLGVQVGPLLAGFGIAGVVVGFAMQSTLSNFAAGGMILGNRPFDLGDEIEVAGVSGVVKRMTLVSTTILTPDNQTLTVPNSSVWGGVIRNRTAQPVRRVDLTFSIGYADDIAKAERVLEELVGAQPLVLKDPAPIIKLHQLADSSVNFVVRVWAARDRYWDVYWELTRAVKLRFDQEGITIPFPQRDVHLTLPREGAKEAAAAIGVTAEG